MVLSSSYIQMFRRLWGYVKYYNNQWPCFAIGYDTPENYRKRFCLQEGTAKKTNF